MRTRLAAVLTGIVICACGEEAVPADQESRAVLEDRIKYLFKEVQDSNARHVSDLESHVRDLEGLREQYDRRMVKKEAQLEEARGRLADRDAALGPRIGLVEAQSSRLKAQRRELKAVPASHWLSRLDSDDLHAQWFAIDALARWHVGTEGVLKDLLRLALTEDERFGSRVLDLLSEYWRNPDMAPTVIELIQTSEATDLVGAALELCRRAGGRARSLLPALEKLDFSDRHTPKVRKQLAQVISELKPK